MLEGARAQALWRDDGRCRGLVCDDGRVIAARAVVLATGGAAALWARTTNPPGSQGVGLLLAHAAGAALADLELLQFHPTAVIGVARTRGLPRHRGDPRRGRDAARRRRRALRRRARAARRGLARDPGAPGRRPGERSVGLDMRAIDPAHFPNVVAALREAGLDPARELIPVAPAAHYMMGGIVTDLHARSTLAGPVRGRRVLVHRPARRQPARLELAQRVLRVRPPRRRRRAVASRRAAADAGERASSRRCARCRAPPRRRRAPRARRCGATRASCAAREGLRRAARGPPPARPPDRALRARARARAAARTCALDHPERDPALDHRHVVVCAATSSSWQTWD